MMDHKPRTPRSRPQNFFQNIKFITIVADKTDVV